MLGHDQHTQRICPGPCAMPLKDGERCTNRVCIAATFDIPRDLDRQLFERMLVRRRVLDGRWYGGAQDGAPVGVANG